MLSRAHDVPLLIVANLKAVCLGLLDKCRDIIDLLMFDILIIKNYCITDVFYKVLENLVKFYCTEL
jgi:hypothetical protein